MSRDLRLVNASVMQYLNTEYWYWTNEEKQALVAADTQAIGQIMVDRLHYADMPINEFHIIVHDRDIDEEGKLKPAHIHAAINFGKERHSLIRIAEVLGLDEQFVGKPMTKGRYAYDNMLAYLIHAKDSHKYQYSASDVVSWAKTGRAYVDIERKQRANWARGMAKKTKDRAIESRDWIVDMALKGYVDREELLASDDDALFEAYSHSRKDIDNALEMAGARKSARAAKKLRDGEFTKNTIIMTGEAGLGKSKHAFELARRICEKGSELTGDKWRYYAAADRNSLDNYLGEEVMVFDDQDGSGLTGTAWKTLLAPTEANPVGTRYVNKGAIAPRVMIITTTMTTYGLAAAMRGGSGAQTRYRDPIGQYLRRFEYELRMDRVISSASTEDKDAMLAFTAKLLSEIDGDVEPVIDIREVDGRERYIREKTKWGWETFMVTTDEDMIMEVLANLGMLQRGGKRDELIANARNYSQDMNGYITMERRNEIREQERLEKEAEQRLLEPSVWDAVGHTAY